MQSRIVLIMAVIALIVSAGTASPMITGTNALTAHGYNNCINNSQVTPVSLTNGIECTSLRADDDRVVKEVSYDSPLSISAPQAGRRAMKEGRYADDEGNVRVIVMFKGKPKPKLITQYRGEIKHKYQIIPAVAATMPEETAVTSLESDSDVAYIEPDYEVQVTETLPWGVDRINAELIWNGVEGKSDVAPGGNAGSGIAISVIDTGIDYNHPDLADNYEGGYDFVNEDSDPKDDNGHGTHCAGIIAARDNGAGIVGVAPEADLYAVKVMNSEGRGYISDVIAGIDWSVKNNIKIISMSIGSTQDSTAFRNACDKAYNAGLLLVASAGNRGNADGTGDTVTYPGRYDSVIAVAATDSANNRASFSSTGSDVELAAPGVSIYSTYLNNGYATKSGTSMACPHVTGTAALAWSAYPDYTNVQVRALLQETAEDIGTTGKDDDYGYGMVNAEKTAYVSASDNTAPASIVDLKLSQRGETWLKWTWSNPSDIDFRYTMVFLNGIWVTNTSDTYYYVNGLMRNSTYELGTHTVDRAGNVNTAWVNHTGKTEDETVLQQSSTTFSPAYYYGRTVSSFKTWVPPVSNKNSYKRWTPLPGRQMDRYHSVLFNRTASNNIYPIPAQGKTEIYDYRMARSSSFVPYVLDAGKGLRTALYKDYGYPRVIHKTMNVTAGKLYPRYV